MDKHLEEFINEAITEDGSIDLINYYIENNYSLIEKDDCIIVKYILIGSDVEDISLTLKGDILYLEVNKSTISSGLKDSFQIPENIGIDNIQAQYKGGLLIIMMPRLTSRKSRSVIEIK